jgi:hypothetical protein
MASFVQPFLGRILAVLDGISGGHIEVYCLIGASRLGILQRALKPR